MSDKAKARKVIRTTGQLREKLAAAIVAVTEGRMSPEEMRQVSAEADRALKQLSKKLKDLKSGRKR